MQRTPALKTPQLMGSSPTIQIGDVTTANSVCVQGNPKSPARSDLPDQEAPGSGQSSRWGRGSTSHERPKRSQRVYGVSDESTGGSLRDSVVRRMSPGTEEVRRDPKSMTAVIASAVLQLMAACGEA